MAYLLVALVLVLVLPSIKDATMGRAVIVSILAMVALYFNSKLKKRER